MADQSLDISAWIMDNHDQQDLSNSGLWNSDDIFDLHPLLPNFPATPPPAQDPHHHLPRLKDAPVSAVTDTPLHTSPVAVRPHPLSRTAAHPNLSNAVRVRLQQHKPVADTPIHKPIPKTRPVSSLHLASSSLTAPLSHQKNFKSPRSAARRTPNFTHVKMETPIVSPVLSAKRAAQKSVIPSKRPPEESRQRHNQMMRENRSRFNNKFKELTDLLDIFKEPGCDYKPMKNKIQILERAIYQYAQMEAKHDRYHKELMFSPDNPDHVPSEYLSVFAAVPALTDACDLLMQYMCSMHAWKYGEAWILKPTDHHSHSADSSAYQLSSVFVAKNNMPDTRQALQQYAQNSSTHRIDQFILSQAFQDHPIWIPNLTAKHTTNLRTEHAKDAKLGTTLVIPIRIKQASGTHPDAVLTLMHVNDDLLSYQNDVRPYDSVSITTALDLVAAVAKSRTKESA